VAQDLIIRFFRRLPETASLAPHRQERRESPRYELRLPLELIRKGAEDVSEQGETRNLSSKGILFQAQTRARIGEVVEFVVTLPTGSRSKAVRLHCSGRVVRCASESEIAATLERYEFIRTRARAS